MGLHNNKRWFFAAVLSLATVSRVPVASALAAPKTAYDCDVDHDGREDLAVGVPGESRNGKAEVGVVV